MDSLIHLKKWVLERLYWQDSDFQPIYKTIDRIEGYLISPMEEYCLYKLASRVPKGGTVLEIGSFKGRSTSCLAFGTKGHVYAIDIFSHLEDFKRNMKSCGLEEKVTPIQGRSEDIAARWTLPVDLLFIDGCHNYAKVLEDFRDYYPYVVQGGTVALHDVSNEWLGPLVAWDKNIHALLRECGSSMSISYGVKP